MIHNEHEVFTSCQASLSQELRKTKQQLQLSELQKQKLLTSLQDTQGIWGSWWVIWKCYDYDS